MIQYNPPTGSDLQDPSLSSIEAIILEKTAQYWKEGSGDSSLQIDGCEEQLIFFYDEPYGFFVMRHPDYLVLFDGDKEIQTTQHPIGGEPMRIPTCSYISRDMMLSIVRKLFSTYKIPESVGGLTWKPLYDIPFDSGF